MQGYNAIVVFNKEADKMLMCKRRRNPYKGLSNFVGGKIEKDENGLDAAYRELAEETAITKNDIVLTHLMDFTYHLGNCYLEVYVGKLNKAVTVVGDENDLYWSSLEHNFFDASQYAGEGNIGHIMMHVEMFKDKLLLQDGENEN
ncbi:MAG: NUDIX hydrolase [Ruminococcaceae bacterium]|nr:NUDIX hydrolase [Oscillospiraceae bacterium]